jgi:hypothetical protein
MFSRRSITNKTRRATKNSSTHRKATPHSFRIAVNAAANSGTPSSTMPTSVTTISETTLLVLPFIRIRNAFRQPWSNVLSPKNYSIRAIRSKLVSQPKVCLNERELRKSASIFSALAHLVETGSRTQVHAAPPAQFPKFHFAISNFQFPDSPSPRFTWLRVRIWSSTTFVLPLSCYWIYPNDGIARMFSMPRVWPIARENSRPIGFARSLGGGRAFPFIKADG